MRRISIFIILLVGVGILYAGSEYPVGTKSQTNDINIAAVFFQTEPADDCLGRIAQRCQLELELKDKDSEQPIKLNVYPAEQTDPQVLKSDPRNQYYIETEITERRWKVSRSFQIPFMFFVYHKSFNIQAIFRVYRQGSDRPVIVRKYKIHSSGPRVVQIFENNPQDGGLMVTHGQRLELEQKAENKLAKNMINDLYYSLNEQGG
jgi:hypothetical protein